MKKSLFVFWVMLIGQWVSAQSCLPNGIFFFTQDDVNTFPVNYPGCKVIEGSVRFGSDYVFNLDSLYNITTIEDSLIISFCNSLNNIKGLSNLSTIGGSLELGGFPAVDLKGLDSLKTIGASLTIGNMWKITSLEGLNHLQSVGDALEISYNTKLESLSGLDSLKTIAGNLRIEENPNLYTLTGLGKLSDIAGDIYVGYNAILGSFNGLNSLNHIGKSLYISNNQGLISLTGLERIKKINETLWIGGNTNVSLTGLDSLVRVDSNLVLSSSILDNLHGLESLISVGGNLGISYTQATNLSGLANLKKVGGSMSIFANQYLNNLQGLENLDTIGLDMDISQNPSLANLHGLEGLKTIGGSLWIHQDHNLFNLSGLSGLSTVGNSFNVTVNNNLKNLEGAENLSEVGAGIQIAGNEMLTALAAFPHLKSANGIGISQNNALEIADGFAELEHLTDGLGIFYNTLLLQLTGFKKLAAIDGVLNISSNYKLYDISGLSNVSNIGGKITLESNYALSDCSLFAICKKIGGAAATPDVHLFLNGTGCNQIWEINNDCHPIPAEIQVLADQNVDCTADPGDLPVDQALVKLASANHFSLGLSDNTGKANVKFFDYEPIIATLPEFPSAHWAICQDSFPIALSQWPDSNKATFLLQALDFCPELETRLQLPPFFRGCLVATDMRASVQNIGAAPAGDALLVIVLPFGLEVIQAAPAPTATLGDTLVFSMGDLEPFETRVFDLRVKTSCDIFLLDHTLCVEAFASFNNPCPDNSPDHSEIKLSAVCNGDSVLQFEMTNIGNAPTQAPHQYTLYKNGATWQEQNFSLNEAATLPVAVTADGSTWRLEATKFDDGMLAAIAYENCGGLTPGLITAFWLDDSPTGRDFDCRRVVTAYDPNRKSAIPEGAGPEHFIAANKPIQYTIEFQNTGSDTAFSVLLRDVLPSDVETTTFRPGLASHPYSWSIRDHTLEVLFLPIALPDSNVNEAASHGFFTFSIDQKPDLSPGTQIQNSAGIVFDNNPIIWTNTVVHTIGKPGFVPAIEPFAKSALWKVLGNPTSDAATFIAGEPVEGENLFRLFDAIGRPLRAERFTGQSFEFRRAGLPSGWYVFHISDEKGRLVVGSIVLTE